MIFNIIGAVFFTAMNLLYSLLIFWLWEKGLDFNAYFAFIVATILNGFVLDFVEKSRKF